MYPYFVQTNRLYLVWVIAMAQASICEGEEGIRGLASESLDWSVLKHQRHRSYTESYLLCTHPTEIQVLAKGLLSTNH